MATTIISSQTEQWAHLPPAVKEEIDVFETELWHPGLYGLLSTFKTEFLRVTGPGLLPLVSSSCSTSFSRTLSSSKSLVWAG